jgi:hypothetical protein
MSARHTPGPWFTFANGTCVGGPVGILGNPSGAETAGIAHCGMALRTGDELQANARLIAAAPELLQALREAEAGLEFCGADKPVAEGGFVPTPTLALRVVRAAIAKATGAEPDPIPVGEAKDSDFGAFQEAAR